MIKTTTNQSQDYVWYAIKCQPFKDWIVLDYLVTHPEMCKQARIITDNSKPQRKNGKFFNLSPGVIFVQLLTIKGEINSKIRKWILNVPYVKGFKNYRTRSLSEPMPFSAQMIANLVNQKAKPKVKHGKYSTEDINFAIGDYLLVLRGIFSKYEGELIKIDYNTGILTIKTEFFGRLTQIEVSFLDCKKVTE